MREAIKLYRLFNVLSLDVALGAIIGSLFFSKIYEEVPSFPSLISLGLTVWIIYTADRLLDIRNITGEAASERHRFHQRNRKKLFYYLLAATIVDMVLIFFMPAIIFQHGILLSLAVGLYIILRRRLHWSKELFVAVLYTAGVVLPAWPVNQPDAMMHLPILLFFLIALINLIIFSWYEKENDLREHQNSIATLVVEKIVRQILIGLFIFTFSVSSCLFFLPANRIIAFVIVAMTALLFLIFWYKEFFAKHDYYRLVGDAVFLLPVISLLA